MAKRRRRKKIIWKFDPFDDFFYTKVQRFVGLIKEIYKDPARVKVILRETHGSH